MHLAAEYQRDEVRALAAERVGDELAVRWHGTVREGDGPEERAEAVAAAVRTEGLEPETVSVALPVSPGMVVRGLELPPLDRSEVDQVARDELRRISGEGIDEVDVRGWQYRSEPDRGPNVLAVGVPATDVEEGLAFGRSLPGRLRLVSPTPVVLQQGLLAADLAPGDRLSGFLYLARDFGFVGYTRGPAWVSSHVFPLGGQEGEEADRVVKEMKRSLIGLRSREDAGRPSSVILAGQLPQDDLALQLGDELPEADIREFTLEETLRLDGIPHPGRFLSRQSRYAIPLLLARHGEEFTINYVPRSARLPEMRADLLRSVGAAVGAGLLLVGLHWGWTRWQASSLEQRTSELRSELQQLEPRFAHIREEKETRARLSVYRGLREMTARQMPLVEEALRSLSRAVTEGVSVDSLVVRQGTAVLSMELGGAATANTSSLARSRFDQFVARMRGSPVFASVAVPRQELGRRPDGTLAVTFRVRAALAGRLSPAPEEDG